MMSEQGDQVDLTARPHNVHTSVLIRAFERDLMHGIFKSQRQQQHRLLLFFWIHKQLFPLTHVIASDAHRLLGYA